MYTQTLGFTFEKVSLFLKRVYNAGPLFHRVVCHRLASDGPHDVSDKFKIELFYEHRGSIRPIGRKHVISTLLKSRSNQQVCIIVGHESKHLPRKYYCKKLRFLIPEFG